MHPLDGRNQKEYSYWSQNQALKTENKMKGKPHRTYGSPHDKQHNRQKQKKIMTISGKKRINRNQNQLLLVFQDSICRFWSEYGVWESPIWVAKTVGEENNFLSTFLGSWLRQLCNKKTDYQMKKETNKSLITWHHPVYMGETKDNWITSFFWILFIFLYSRIFLVIHFIHITVYRSNPISQFITPPPPPPLLLSPLGVHTFVLYICVSISALRTSSSVPFF